MRPEGHEENNEEQDELFDDVPENFLLCALHQAKIICERWKFWSGTVPMDVSIRLHRLESMISTSEIIREKNSIVDNHRSSDILGQKMDSIQVCQTEIQSYPTLERIFAESPRRIILQGPEIVEEKHRVHFWCCH